MSTALDSDLRDALALIIAKDERGELFDHNADEGGYRSQELEDALDVIRAALDKA
jgi:hypothetical protein